MAEDGRVHWADLLPGGVQHLVAEKIQIIQDDKIGVNSSIALKLENLKGCLYQPKDDRVVLLAQADHTLRFDLPSSARLLPASPLPHLDTSDLLQHAQPKARVELARRFALPFATAALLLLGLAFGAEHARFRKGGAILRSLGVIVLYYVLLKLFEDRVTTAAWSRTLPLFLLPFGFLGWGCCSSGASSNPTRRATSGVSGPCRPWFSGFAGPSPPGGNSRRAFPPIPRMAARRGGSPSVAGPSGSGSGTGGASSGP